jgi:MarR family 2-MHQ and catechol resistance regulon transcriptional repressor
MTTMLTPAQNDVPSEAAFERDAEALHEALSALVRLYQFRDRDQICCFDVSVPQCYGLEALVKEGPLTLGELADRLYLEKSTASRVVDALERKGYVTRAPHPGDRRALRLTATPAGRRLVGRIRASLMEESKAVLADLSPAFRREAARFLTRLTTAAAGRLGRGPVRAGRSAAGSEPDEATSCCPPRGRDR